jgi:hypothetical protein
MRDVTRLSDPHLYISERNRVPIFSLSAVIDEKLLTLTFLPGSVHVRNCQVAEQKHCRHDVIMFVRFVKGS